MEEVCQTCGLPKNLCVCSQISKEEQKIKVRTVKRSFGKVITTVTGIDDEKIAKELGKTLKRKLACGGTVKNNGIELQGDHKRKIKKLLVAEGYKGEFIDDQRT